MTSLTLRSFLSTEYKVEVGDYSYGALLVPGAADAQTTVGRYVSIGPGVRRFGASHPLDYTCLHPYWYNPNLALVNDRDVPRSGIEIAAGSWIGANALILPGCRRVGVGAVVGAGSVVTKDVPDFAVVVGNPAKVVKYRLSSEKRKQVLESRYWELPPELAFKALEAIKD